MRSSQGSTRQARPRCSCRCRRTPTSRRRRSRRRGFFLPARYGEPLPPAAEWDAYFAEAGDRPVRLEATPSYFYGGSAVAEAMRDRLVDPHALVVLREPVSARHLVLHVPEDPAALPRRLPHHRLPRHGRPAHRRRLRRSRQREVHGVPRRVLRRLPPRMARRARRRPTSASSTSTGSSATRSPRCTRPRRGSASIRRGSPPTRSAPRTARPATRARASSDSRSPATTSSSACCGGTPRSSASCAPSTTGSTAVPPRSPSPMPCAPSWPHATRNPTPGSLSSSAAAGIALPGWLSPSDPRRSGVGAAE